MVMVVTECPQCSWQMTRELDQCPQCGHPFAKGLAVRDVAGMRAESRPYRGRIVVGWTAIAYGAVLFLSGIPADVEWAMALGLLLVFGGAIVYASARIGAWLYHA